MSSIDTARNALNTALKEVDAERKRILSALAALEKSAVKASGLKRGRKPAAAAKPAAGKKAWAPRPGSNHEKVLKTIKDNPEIQAKAIAEKTSINATAVSSITKKLAENGYIKKNGRKISAV